MAANRPHFGTQHSVSTSLSHVELPCSRGLLGSVKELILYKMLAHVPGRHKVLICDRVAAELLSRTVRVHEMMDCGVVLIEDLAFGRQPLIRLPAIYFISPCATSVQRVVQDWKTKFMYREAHIFFTGVTPTSLIDELARQPLLVRRIRTVMDMLLDFVVTDSLSFHLNMTDDMQRLFSLGDSKVTPTSSVVREIAGRLAFVFFSMGCGVPSIRYQRDSASAQSVAECLLDTLAHMAKDVPDFQLLSTRQIPPILLLVDRSFDAVEVLRHECTYQSLLDDLMPLDDNMYEQTFTDRKGETHKRQAKLDESDPYWCAYRHRPILACLEELPKQLDELLAAHPELAKSMNRDANLSELGNAVRALPEFQEKQMKLSIHIDICTNLMHVYREQSLAKVCEVEADLVGHRSTFKEGYATVRRLTSDASIPAHVRLRLFLLFHATANSLEFTTSKQQQLLEGMGLIEAAACSAALKAFVRDAGKLHGGAANFGGPGGPPATLASQLFPLRGNRSSSPTDFHSRSTSTGTPAADRHNAFRSQAYHLLEAIVTNTLNASDFPCLNPARDVAQVEEVPRSPKKRTLRMGVSRMAAGNAVGPVTTSTGVPGGATILDIGHEGRFPLSHPRKVVLFVLGGVTYGDTLAAYEVAKRYARETMVGSTSFTRPDKFVQQLQSLR